MHDFAVALCVDDALGAPLDDVKRRVAADEEHEKALRNLPEDVLSAEVRQDAVRDGMEEAARIRLFCEVLRNLAIIREIDEENRPFLAWLEPRAPAGLACAPMPAFRVQTMHARFRRGALRR